MTLARRILLPTTPSHIPFVLSAAPHGGWCWFDGPSAVHDAAAGKTIVGYINGTNGDLCVRTFDDGTLADSGEHVIYPAFEQDDHDAPSFLVRNADDVIAMAYANHVGDLYYGDAATAGILPPNIPDARQRNITSDVGARSGSAGYTYAGLAQLSAEADTIYIFFRWHNSGGTAHLSFTKSTDNGTTWAARTDVLTMSYHQFVVNGSDRVDFVCSPHPTDDPGPHSIYHFYKQGSSYHKSDGTLITASLPFGPSDITLVYDGTSVDAWLWDIAIDGSGNPVISYATFPSTTDHRANYATWNGSSWTSHQVAAMGTYIPTGIVPGAGAIEDHYSGGIALDHSDPTIAYVSIGRGSDLWDVYRYQTADGGATWTSYALTSSGKNVRPISVRDHDASLQVIWVTGRYTDYVDYSQGISGAVT